eukprot:9169974-Alexandrium_andersonii.AAC.1
MDVESQEPEGAKAPTPLVTAVGEVQKNVEEQVTEVVDSKLGDVHAQMAAMAASIEALKQL